MVSGLLGIAPAALVALVIVERLTSIDQRAFAEHTLDARRRYVQALAWHVLDGIALCWFQRRREFSDTGELAVAISAAGGYRVEASEELASLAADASKPDVRALRRREAGYDLMVGQVQRIADADRFGTWAQLAEETALMRLAFAATLADYDPDGPHDGYVDSDAHGLAGKLVVQVATLKQLLDKLQLDPWHGPTRPEDEQ